MLKFIKALRIASITAALFLQACVHASAVDSLPEALTLAREGMVVTVAPNLIDTIVKQNADKPVLIEFVTDWCQVCKAIKRDVSKLAKAGAGRYLILRVDVTQDDKTREKYSMQPYYPGFKLYSPGLPQPIERYGSNELMALETWLKAPHDKVVEAPMVFHTRISPKPARAILIAGSAENANFAQEVTWMMELVQYCGVKADEIECFYARPDPFQYFEDKAQFDKIAPLLKSCRASDRGEILRAVQRSFIANPRNVFLYATSHGAPPSQDRPAKDEKDCFVRAPSLIVDNGDNECESANHLTPESIASVIPLEADAQKTFVFQACYSGGFISDDNDINKSQSGLTKLQHVNILTAARADRPSFGCGSGDVATYFGLAFTSALIDDKRDLAEIDWAEIYRNTKVKTEEMEKKLRVPQSSEPQYFEKR
jgi:thiol-disulfide isomerase/thioredoxin